MGKTYINGIGCVSAQKTFDTVFLEEAVLNESLNVLPLELPTYKDYISPIAARRMSKAVKNGIVASTIAMKEAHVDTFDAIITGTGMGCIEDSDKFLKAIIDNNEEFLTPTSFIQSTHNTVGAQIALGMTCKAYNFTYVNAAVSFESAVFDAKMQIDADESKTILVGGIDEMTDYTQRLFKLAGFIKNDEEGSFPILNSKSKGTVFSEGATFFVLENKKSTSTYVEIVDIEMVNSLEVSEVESKIISFLKQNNLEVSDVDAVVLGINGDMEFDNYYKSISESAFKNTPQVYYKHLSGEYNTASAFGLFVGSKIIKAQQIPDILKANAITKSEIKHLLLYNQYRGIDHSFTLISKC
ncbi:3-oxoacyl-ACP synthase [Flavobacterium noncentrifugens]|uniref:3-oxoacyl-(Acyl-carrier-protein) synthase n=1 Tax=Flavobacterium noncentrifugens TaxID=1128970 RepID=A0A1G8SCW4_9FLAO|nr:beta-ketoacyl synthase N-terminal-like domain-containing protein [Flavobacterium noncentrifugens]GEP49780.1 3-oxoacyl-ACP synthase [Flavobacterium noncentrifugens]SDJ27001.1 3-oxoacyl-(acyl-carrier-protein) synthase [Flavobacterium noncentrifugens]